MKWTEKQQEAIDLRGKNILVAAAAGSGKTAVLVERIKNLILEEGVSVDELLVVTFTNAAAAEMREKILKAVTFALEKEQGDAAFLQKQLNIINRANISTFHAFALEIIRRYFHIIDMDPGFKICDTSQQIILQEQALDLLMEEEFESESPTFLNFLNCYCTGKSEKNVRDMIITLYTYIQSIPESQEWLERAVASLHVDESDFLNTEVFKNMKVAGMEMINSAKKHCINVGEILEEAGTEKLRKKVEDDIKGLADIQEYLEKFFKGEISEKDISSKLDSFNFVRLVASKDEKESYEYVKNRVENSRKLCKQAVAGLKNQLFALPIKEQLEHMAETSVHSATLAALTMRFGELFGELKKERLLLDFNDIEHYAIKILKTDSVAAEYRDKFKYIFIDEYQDSNMVQEQLISFIKGDNNLFMVGDVKQSIYKFRQADPELFMGKYKDYASGNGEQDVKIDLNFNFRSKAGIIEGVNKVFEEVMDGYDDAAALHHGIDYTGDLDYGTELHIMDSSSDEDVDEEIKELTNVEKEAYIVGNIINKALGTTIYDTKKQVERPLTKRDIVILLRGQKNYGDKFRNVLANMDIPSHVNDSDGYFDTLEIGIFMNLLKIIDNIRQDVPLISVLHSQIFGYSASELSAIRIWAGGEKISFCDAFLRYAEETTEEEKDQRDVEIRRKTEKTLKEIYRWRSYSRSLPLDRFIWKVMIETGYYNFAGALPGGSQRQANLRALVDKAISFQSSRMQGLYGFINYVDTIKSRKVSTGQVTLVGENDDVVRIMTIHKSKGLEYPFVIIAGLGKKFNISKGGRMSLHKHMGIGLSYVNSKLKYHRKTLNQKLIDMMIKKEELEEELRVLYVAFTRPQDKLILVGNYRAEKVEDASIVPGLYESSCYLDMLVPVAKKKGIPVLIHGQEEIGGVNFGEVKNRLEINKLLDADKRLAKDEKIFGKIDEMLSYEYRYKNAGNFKSKFSVSLMNKMENLIKTDCADCNEYRDFYYENMDRKALRKPNFIDAPETPLSPAQKGTLLHKMLEYWDYKFVAEIIEKDGYSGVKAYAEGIIENLSRRGFLDSRDAAYLLEKTDKIISLQESDFGKRLAAADKVYKEEAFTLMKKIQGEEILIQGIIDCYFEEAGEYILADYKSSYVREGDESSKALILEKYKNQLKLYAEGLSESKSKPVKAAYIVLINSGEAIEVDID